MVRISSSPRVVPQRIVDVLEMIGIDHEHADHRVLARPGSQHVVEAVAVGQSGQAVAIGSLPQASLRPVPFRDVLKCAEDPSGGSVVNLDLTDRPDPFRRPGRCHKLELRVIA